MKEKGQHDGVLTSEALSASKALGRFEIIEVGNNQTSNPMVSPKRLSVAMHEGPTFPKEGKVKGSPGKGVPSLVLLGFDDINVNVYAIIIVLCISIDKSIIRTRSLRSTHSQETQHLSWETL